MKTSRVLRDIREGRLASCLKLNISHPHIVELAGLSGASAVWLCNEHVLNGWQTLEHCVRAAKIHDMDVIVRVSKGSYSDYIKPFEADATGIMVPHVSSASEARQIVETCRFFPLGRRPLDGGNVDGKFCQTPLVEYLETSNQEKFIILQIESPEAVENVQEIASVVGYDFLLFGPGDYAHCIGHAGVIQHPEVLAARHKVEEAARQHGKKLFAVGMTGTQQEQLDRGYAVANLGSDVWCLGDAFRNIINKGCPPPTPPALYSRP